MVRRPQLANGPCNKDYIKMNRTCSGITGIIKSLKSSLNELDKGKQSQLGAISVLIVFI